MAEARLAISNGLREVVERFEREEKRAREEAVQGFDAVAAGRIAAVEEKALALSEARAAETRLAVERALGARVAELVGSARSELRDHIGAEMADALEVLRTEADRRSAEAAEQVRAAALAAADEAVAGRLAGAERELRERADRHDQELAERARSQREALEVTVERRTAEQLALASGELVRTAEQRSAWHLSQVRQESQSSLAAITAARGDVARRIDAAAEKVSLKSRRHELKLARQESSKRIEAALAGLEERAGSLGADLERRGRAQRAALDAAGRSARGELEAGITERSTTVREQLAEARAELERRTAATDDQVGAALSRLDEGMERVNGALVEIYGSERRIIEAQGRLGETEARVTAAARTAREAADWEARMSKATEIEEEAARRIREAEERLRDSLQ